MDQFEDIIAATEEVQAHLIKLSKDQETNYVKRYEFDLYGVPADREDGLYDKIFNYNYSGTIHIGKLCGWLILCKQIIADGDQPMYLCSDIGYDIGAVISCLSDPTGPLDKDPFQDVFYIEELEMDKGYDDDDLKITILRNLSDIILNLKNVRPELIAYYPTPLPYELDIHTKIKRSMADIIFMEMAQNPFSVFTEDGIDANGKEYQLTLDEEQLNYIMGNRNPNSSYPESAKDMPIWEFYQKAGFVESGISRLLYLATNTILEDE